MPPQSVETPLLYILHSGNLYGTERMALATLAGLDEYRLRVVFAPKAYGTGSVELAARSAGFETRCFNGRFELLKRLLPWFARYRSLDVIGTGLGQSLLCLALAQVFRVRLRQLHVVHGGTHEGHAYGRKHYLNRTPVTLVAVSGFVKEKLTSYGVERSRIWVIENFLAAAELAAPPRRASFAPVDAGHRSIDPARVRVMVVSRLDAIKRLDLLLDAVECGGLADFVFDVYGTGTDFDALRRRAEVLANVRFHGFVADVPLRLAQADLFLHLCPDEPFGLAVLEAFAAGVPVVVPDSGGAGSLVEPGISGLRFRANDAADLVAVLNLAKSFTDTELQALVEGGRAALRERFSAEAGIRQYRLALASRSHAGDASKGLCKS